jgi:hypothetical protein
MGRGLQFADVKPPQGNKPAAQPLGSIIVGGYDLKSGARQRFDYAFRNMLGLLGAYFALGVIFASIQQCRRNYRI